MESYVMELMKTRLRETREEWNLTQRELGDMIGVGKGVIMALENMTVLKGCNLDALCDVCDVLDISVDWLFGRSDQKGIVEVPVLQDKLVVKKFFNPKWEDDYVARDLPTE